MVGQFKTEATMDIKLKLLSTAALLRKVRDGITIEELYKDAERKFDILIELLSDTYTNTTIFGSVEFSLDDLKQVSLLILDRLISNRNSNPYITLCVSEEASLEEIKRRRNKLLQIFHPDRNLESFANLIKTKKINEAYDTIVSKYNETGIPFKNTKIDIPLSYPYKKRRTLFFVIVIFLLAFIGTLFYLLNI